MIQDWLQGPDHIWNWKSKILYIMGGLYCLRFLLKFLIFEKICRVRFMYWSLICNDFWISDWNYYQNGKNIYVRYMSKCIKYIFAKSCIIKIYFTYIFYIKVRYFRQNIFSWSKVVYVAYIFAYIFAYLLLATKIYLSENIFCTFWYISYIYFFSCEILVISSPISFFNLTKIPFYLFRFNYKL